jgi:hypothetical protein
LIPGSDLLSVLSGVDITEKGRGKKGGSSFADSGIGTSGHSVVTGATFTGISQFSEVRCRPHNLFTIMQISRHGWIAIVHAVHTLHVTYTLYIMLHTVFPRSNAALE